MIDHIAKRFGPAPSSDTVLTTLTRAELDSTLLSVESEFTLRYADAGPAQYQAFVAGAHKLAGFDSADVSAVQLQARAKHDIVVDSFTQRPEMVAEEIAALVKSRQSRKPAFVANKGKKLFFERGAK